MTVQKVTLDGRKVFSDVIIIDNYAATTLTYCDLVQGLKHYHITATTPLVCLYYQPSID